MTASKKPKRHARPVRIRWRCKGDSGVACISQPEWLFRIRRDGREFEVYKAGAKRAVLVFLRLV